MDHPKYMIKRCTSDYLSDTRASKWSGEDFDRVLEMPSGEDGFRACFHLMVDSWKLKKLTCFATEFRMMSLKQEYWKNRLAMIAEWNRINVMAKSLSRFSQRLDDPKYHFLLAVFLTVLLTNRKLYLFFSTWSTAGYWSLKNQQCASEREPFSAPHKTVGDCNRWWSAKIVKIQDNQGNMTVYQDIS